jgi:hypothetical protein
LDRVLRPLGCFGSTLLAILYALGVTETLKHAGSLGRVAGLSAAVLASAAVAYLRERWRARPRRAGDRSAAAEPLERLDAARLSARLGEVAQRSEDQAPRVDPRARPVASSAPPLREPPAGPSDDPILAARRQAILFRQIVPPSHDPRHLSFFGGVPIAPPGFRWPAAPDASGGSQPISFLMQVDCGAIPAAGRLGLMPDRGVLYVFHKAYSHTFRVLYEPGPADGWAESAPPETLDPVYEWPSAWHWPQSDADSPRLWPKWPFDPVLVQGGPLPDDEEAREATYSWPGTIDVPAAIRAIPGAVVPHTSFYDDVQRTGGKSHRPFATYPHDWGAIRIATGLLAEQAKQNATLPRWGAFKDMSDGEFAAMLDRAAAERRRWEERASAAAPFDEVPQDERDRFWAWMAEQPWVTRFVVQDAANLSVEASLAGSARAGARIPAAAVDRIRHRHALAVETERGLHINIPDRMLAAPVDVQGDIDERVRDYLLLLELSSNEGLAHYFAEGVFQFWIRPADLAARRFDRVELSSTAY